MNGEKSEQGIVVKKLTGKVAKVSDLILVIKKSPNPKGRDSVRSLSVHGRRTELSYNTSCLYRNREDKSTESGSNRRVDRMGRSTL
jgi:hypothetical protein